MFKFAGYLVIIDAASYQCQYVGRKSDAEAFCNSHNIPLSSIQQAYVFSKAKFTEPAENDIINLSNTDELKEKDD